MHTCFCNKPRGLHVSRKGTQKLAYVRPRREFTTYVDEFKGPLVAYSAFKGRPVVASEGKRGSQTDRGGGDPELASGGGRPDVRRRLTTSIYLRLLEYIFLSKNMGDSPGYRGGRRARYADRLLSILRGTVAQ